MTEVYLIGCGGNAKVVIDICEKIPYKIMGIFDDKYAGNIINVYHKYSVIGSIDHIAEYTKINIINTVGDCNARNKIYQKLNNLDLNWINCIHPNSYISPTAKIGYGNIICYGAFINSDTVIGNFNLINTCAIIEHDCEIGDTNHFAPKTTLCGTVRIGNFNLIGAGTTIIPNKKIGNNNIIGAMTVIINNFENDNTIIGVPGKINTANKVFELIK